MLVNALARALAERVMLMDLTIGRKGFLSYVKSLAGSNVVKLVPASESASGVRTNGHKRLKVVCGTNTSYLDDEAWIKQATGKGKGGTPMTFCEIRVSPSIAVKPNIGNTELAEALNRVLPFTAKDDNRPVLQCVNFVAGEGKLKLVSADGFRLAVVTLDYDGEGQALINREDLRGIPNALRKAKRVALSFEKSGDSLDGMSLIIDTEVIRYKWRGADGQFPDYEKLIPTEHNTVAHFDTTEAIKAIASLKVLANAKGYAIDLYLDDSYITMVNTEEKGQTAIPAEITGKPIKIRLDGNYLSQALKACGGMVELKLAASYKPVLFTTNGYKLVVMPMMTNEASEAMKRDEAREAKLKVETEAKPSDDVSRAVAEAVEIAQEAGITGEADTTDTEPEPVADKPKRKRKAKEPVAV